MDYKGFAAFGVKEWFEVSEVKSAAHFMNCSVIGLRVTCRLLSPFPQTQDQREQSIRQNVSFSLSGIYSSARGTYSSANSEQEPSQGNITAVKCKPELNKQISLQQNSCYEEFMRNYWSNIKADIGFL